MASVDVEKIIETCLLAGKIMLESDAEMYRVEDTMSRIALASGDFQLVSYVTQTGLFVGLDGTSTIRMVQILNRSINLEKVSHINQLSREYVAGRFNIDELLLRLKEVDLEKKFFPLWLRFFSSGY